MRDDGEEPEYLAQPQLPADPTSFEEVVMEAFRLEHGTKRKQDVAAVLGLDKSRITQIFSSPKTLKAETIQNLTSHLESFEHRRRIVKAWTWECFGLEMEEDANASLAGPINEELIHQIDRQIRQQRITLATRVAAQALKNTTDFTQRAQLLDRLFLLRQRLDNVGKAMIVAHVTAFDARKEGNVRRLAHAHEMRLRILISLPDCKPSEVQPVFGTIAKLLKGADPIPNPPPPFVLAQEESLRVLKFGAYLTFLERGVVEPNDELLRKQLAAIKKGLKGKLKYQKRHRLHQTAARIHLAFGETFQAEEHVELAYRSGEMKNLRTFETSGILRSRIMALTASPREREDYLRGVVNTCSYSSDFYHMHMADRDLARLVSTQFPSLGDNS